MSLRHNRPARSRQLPHRDSGRPRRTRCPDHLILAPLWVAYEVNLGTLLRTCDAIGACLAVPDTPHYRASLSIGDTLLRRPHLHWVRGTPAAWLREQREAGRRVVAVEQVDGATPLALLTPARVSTVMLLGHERHGVPAGLDVDEFVEIPMIGSGVSLNVAVAGSLVGYRLAALS